MMDIDAPPACHSLVPEAATLAAPVAASVAAGMATSGRVRPERIEVVLSSDRRREHAPEFRARLVAEMMSGQAAVSELSRREGICVSVLHRWLRRARVASGELLPSGPGRLVPVRVVPAPSEAARSAVVLEVVLGNGRVLRVPPGADPAMVAQMATALEG